MAKQTLFEQMISGVEYADEAERQFLVREAMQKIALVGLQRARFFSEASFYGGTCLRLFHGLPRFSEDMDFSLLHPDRSWTIEKYFKYLEQEYEAAGVEVSISRKEKKGESTIESAFLKSDTALYQIVRKDLPHLKIKLEVDIDPPLSFDTEHQLLMQPRSSMIRCFTLPDLFAGKIHALLYRRWQKRIKGRDWFDFAWFVQQGAVLDLTHLRERIRQNDERFAQDVTDRSIRQRLLERIEATDISVAKRDIAPFIVDQDVLDIWSKEYFAQVVKLMLTTEGLQAHRSPGR
ncbi:MAG: nucleotidyl transferase AbiEii/AbiGii toxin family protein [Coriobacteriia bacterium]|nr:nucleotidyl transferase AbiEii/AbiGii toxin family protein [Coriobacteriia bacterium]